MSHYFLDTGGVTESLKENHDGNENDTRQKPEGGFVIYWFSYRMLDWYNDNVSACKLAFPGWDGGFWCLVERRVAKSNWSWSSIDRKVSVSQRDTPNQTFAEYPRKKGKRFLAFHRRLKLQWLYSQRWYHILQLILKTFDIITYCKHWLSFYPQYSGKRQISPTSPY